MVVNMMASLINDDMRTLIGQEYGVQQRSVPVALSDIRKWAMAVYYPEIPPRLFWDEEFASHSRYGGIVAPEEFNPFAWITSDGPRVAPTFTGPITESGPEGAFGVKPPPTSHILNGGNSAVYGVRMRLGDVITSSRRRVVDYREVVGRLGPTLFTTTEVTWTNQPGERVKTSRDVLIRY